MNTIKFEEISKSWFEIAKHAPNRNFSIELEINRRLLDIFHIGKYYYYIFNCATAQIEFVSDAVTQILGLKLATDFDINFLLNAIHPEDQPYFQEFENRVTAFFTALPPDKIQLYKVSYDYRLRRQNGTYARILQQVVTVQSDEQGGVIRVMGVHTDITHLNKPSGSSLSFIGQDGEPSYYNVHTGTPVIALKKSLFSRREKEVLQKLMEGKTSQEIGDELFISKLTVDGHRKNMLRKTGTASSVELTMKVISQHLLQLITVPFIALFYEIGAL